MQTQADEGTSLVPPGVGPLALGTPLYSEIRTPPGSLAHRT